MQTRWLRGQTGASLIDQAAVSGGNFLTTLALARTLAPTEFGTFSLLFLTLLALNTCHSSLVIYPLTLRGAKATRQQIGGLTGSAMVHTLLLTIPLACLLSVSAWLLHRLDLFLYLVLAMVCWQIQETARRALLCTMRFSDAILPDSLCYVGQGLLILILRPTSLKEIFALVAITSLVAAIWQSALIRVTGIRSFSVEHGRWSWEMGRFILAGNALNMIGMQWPSWILLAVSGAVFVADYQSLLSLAGLANPLIFSINSLLIPIIARDEFLGVRHARLTALRYGVRFGLLLTGPFLIFFVAPHQTMSFVYGAHSPYVPFAALLRLMVITFGVQYAATVVGAYEGGRGRPKSYMWSQFASIGILVTLGTLLISRLGVMGAALAIGLASVVRVASLLYFSWSADHVYLELAPDHLDPY